MEREEKLKELEAQMALPQFWDNKEKAQHVVREYQMLKGAGEGHDGGGATLAILAGAGGDDAEDFVRMLLHMYRGYALKRGWRSNLLDESRNDQGGYRSVLLEVSGPPVMPGTAVGPYGRLKHESGVHRLVRQSPFNAQSKRQTSFALVEVLPKPDPSEKIELPRDIEIQFAKAGGAGGQNVNKRETAVRVSSVLSGISVHVSSERSQLANREKAIELVKAKLLAQQENAAKAEKEGRSIAKTTANEWGSQIRSYVLHPYKMVKDHHTNFESGNPDKVLAGDLDDFIDAAAQSAVE